MSFGASLDPKQAIKTSIECIFGEKTLNMMIQLAVSKQTLIILTQLDGGENDSLLG